MARPLPKPSGMMRLLTPALAPWPAAFILAAVVLLAVAALHHETALSIARIWARSETYAHGWLILPISAWMVWRRRADLAGLEPRLCWWGLAVAALLQLAWLAGSIADVVFVQQASLVAMIPVTVLVLLGSRVTRAVAFPLAYLVFAVPWGESLVPTLQDITAWMSVTLLELSGIPVFWQGRLISIPVGDFEVAEACSGVRYLIASVALGAVYAYLVYRGFWRRAAFVLAAIAVPVVANGIRAYGIIMLAHLSNMRLATGVDHLLYGWLFFGLVMFLLFWVGTFWREEGAAPAPGEHVPGGRALQRAWSGAPRLMARPAACLAVIGLAGAGAVAPAWLESAQPVPSTVVTLPAGADGWRGTGANAGVAFSGYDGADTIRGGVYRPDGRDATVRLLAIHYRQERQGAELITSGNRLYGDGWHWIGEGGRHLAIGDRTLSVRELRVGRGGDRRLIWTWYDIGGWQTAHAGMAKGLAAVRRLGGRPGDATLVAVGAEYDTNADAARDRLRAFLEAHPGVLAPRGLVEER